MRTEIALITGASDGIGKEYARQLQPRCKSLILVGRSEQKLAALKQELSAKAGDELAIHLISVDLASTLGQARVMEAIRQQGPVSILINNAGFARQEKVAESDIDGQQAMIHLHCSSSLTFCRAVLPYMREQGRGQIINVASLAGFLAMPEMAVYAASKAFLVSFSQSLALEEQHSGIKVQCLCPGYTRSSFHLREGLEGFNAEAVPETVWMSAEQVVTESLAELDGQNRLLCMPGRHNLDVALAGVAALGEQLATS